MSDLLWQGLIISVTGLGLTFAALGLIILAITLLERFSHVGAQPAAAGEPAAKEKVAISTLARNTADEEVVAAIAVALAYLRSVDICQSGLGSTLEAGPSAWWLMGQAQQHSLQTLKRHPDGVTGHECDP